MPGKWSAILLFFLFSGNPGLWAQHDSSRQAITPHVSPALKFTENKGQWEQNILFRAQLDGGALFLEKNCLTFNFYDKNKYRKMHHGGIAKTKTSDANIKGHAYKMHFEGANPDPVSEKMQEGPDYENFFIGSDESKWRGNVRNYHQVWLRNLYNGIDYEVITAANGMKYNFYVKPGADPADIRLRYEGVDKIRIKDGALILTLEVNEVIEQRPYAYQIINGRIKPVNCRYTFKDKILGFVFPNGYNKNYALVVDPILIFAAQSGSTADNFGMTATFDSEGNLYAGGTCFFQGYPTTPGAYNINFNAQSGQTGAIDGLTDVVITKYNSAGNALLYSTYIGGTRAEIVTSMIVDKSNNLCFYGATGSSNFPVTTGAYDVTFNGGQPLSFVYNGTNFSVGTDIYISKFNSTGTSLLASTFLGGSGNDGVNHVNILTPLPPPNSTILEYQVDSLQYNYGDQYRGEIQVDVSNNIYIASSTRSPDFPTVNPVDANLDGFQDAVVAKFNSGLTQLVYSTYLGGSRNDCGNSLIVNLNSEVFVAGGTSSANFPTTAGTYTQNYMNGEADGFIVHLNASGNSIIASTFVGTDQYDQVYFIQSDRNDNIYVYGQSEGNIPVVSTPAGPVYSNPGAHQFITRFDNNLSQITLSTVFGNSVNPTGIDISPSAFAVDKCNNIYLSGWGGSIVAPTSIMSNMPLTNATQSTTTGHDFYLMALSPNATTLLYGSYFGGNTSEEHVDGGTSRFDPLGKIYQSVCAGCWDNDDFPVTPGAWPLTPGNPNHSNRCNNGVFKLDFNLQLAISTINTNTVAGCVPVTVTFTNATQPTGAGSTFTWNLGNGVVTSSSLNPVQTYTAPGIYTVSLIVKDPGSCNIEDESITYVTVYPTPTVNFSFTTTPCSPVINTSNSSTGNFGANPYTWNFGDLNTSILTAPSHTYSNSGTYNISLTANDVNGCTTTVTKPVTIFNFTTAVSNATICQGSSTALPSSGGTSYTWIPAGSLSNASAASPIASPSLTTIYTVTIENNSPGYVCSITRTAQVLVNPTPTANFSYSANPCGGGVTFTDQSANNITDWDWSFTANATSTVQNPYYFYAVGSTYPVRLIVANSFGCKDTITKPVTISTPPPLSINAPTIICMGSSVQLTAEGGIAYAWTPTVGLDIPMISSPNASPSVSTEYSVVITTSNSINGQPCQFLLTTSVTVIPLSAIPVSAQANPPYVITGNSTTLIYMGDPGAQVTWYTLGSTTPQTGYTVSATPDRPTTYTAVAVNQACRQSAGVHVDAFSEGCLDKDVFVPNTFTPNGDGQNDLFLARGLKIQEMYFAVYNRWGEMVFETTDKGTGWDGVYKGKPADVGVFGWYLKVKCFNGEETFRKGNVTLIR